MEISPALGSVLGIANPPPLSQQSTDQGVEMEPIAASTSLSAPPQQSVEVTLTLLHNSKPHRFQLDDWRIEEKTLRNRMHRKEKNHSAVESEIFQLLGLFTLFQGVIFSAVAQTNLLKCRDLWSPVLMSLLVSFATLAAVWQRLKVFADLRNDLTKARLQAAGLYERIQGLLEHGDNFDLNDLSLEPQELQDSRLKYGNKLSKLWFEYVWTLDSAVILTVVAFSVTMVASCVRILCRGCPCAH